MKCFNCKTELNGTVICPKCGTNSELLEKTIYISNKFFNIGLKKAKMNDFYGAVDALKKSIAFSKTNVEARNLLGLVYYKTGCLGDALKEWIISSNIKKENNSAGSYIQQLQENTREFERLNEAVKMYNHAVKYIRQKNDDLAVIRLKRAVDLNPDFVKAYNLLSLCYLISSDKAKAMQAAKAALKVDAANADALIYLSKSEAENTRGKKSYEKSAYSGMPKSVSIGSANKMARSIVSFAVGIFCCAVFMLVLVMPAVSEQKQQEIDSLNDNFISAQKEYSSLQQQSSEKIQQLEAENESLKSSLEQAQQAAAEQVRRDSLEKISGLYADRDYKEAASLISGIDMSNASEEDINQYNELKANVISAAAKEYYNEGKAYYDRRDFDNAKNSLNQSLTYAESESDTKYSALYYLARIAMQQEDTETAKKYFEDVMNNHPNSSMRRYATNYYNSL